MVALPLCLGIANASGAPPLAGLIAGIVGGLVVGPASGSHSSIAGPAAGLAVLVLDGITNLGYADFLAAGLIAGCVQIGLGLLRLGVLAHFVPNAVIRGMLASIGVILILKQIPHAVGWDFDYEGDFSFGQRDGQNTFSEIVEALEHVHPVAIAITSLCFLTLFLWRDYAKVKLASTVPAPLIIVVVGSALAVLTTDGAYSLSADHRVSLPTLRSLADLQAAWVTPNFAAFVRPEVWRTGAVIGLVASIWSLMSIEAGDRVDPLHRITPPDQELLAQGGGNLVSAMLGGIPVTSEIVRTITNLQAGARTRLSAILHGAMLALSVLVLAPVLEKIPLAALAVILIAIGIRLNTPQIYAEMWRRGINQFVPFVVTIVAVVMTDLMIGTSIGLAIGLFFVARANYINALVITEDGDKRFVRFTGNVSFLNKGALKRIFEQTRPGGTIIVDGTRSRVIDDDIIDTLRDFQALAPARGIHFELWRSSAAAHPFFRGSDLESDDEDEPAHA